MNIIDKLVYLCAIDAVDSRGKNATVGQVSKVMKEDRMSYAQTKKILDELQTGELITCSPYTYRKNVIACRYTVTPFGVAFMQVLINQYPHLKDKFHA